MGGLLRSMFDHLPPELLRACLGHLTAEYDLAHAEMVCRAFRAEASSDELWRALHQCKWPPWTLLAMSAPTGREKVRYAQRLNVQNHPHAFSSNMHVLKGRATDYSDGNVTPMECVMCIAPPSRLSKLLQISGKLLAQVSYGTGSLHNTPALKCWLGGVHCARGVPAHIGWREHASTFGHWVYQGLISEDGRCIYGSYYLSMLPRKRGTFELHVCDPSTHVGDSLFMNQPLPTPSQLSKRVAVKWCSSALQKRAAQEELAASVAAGV